jgi:hypothetical protein
MTSVTPLSIPASGVSARPAPGQGDGRASRAVEPVKAPEQRSPHPDFRERRATGAGDGPALQAAASLSAGFPAPPPGEAGEGRSPLERASDAYRKAGAEPPRYSEEPRLFSVRV